MLARKRQQLRERDPSLKMSIFDDESLKNLGGNDRKHTTSVSCSCCAKSIRRSSSPSRNDRSIFLAPGPTSKTMNLSKTHNPDGSTWHRLQQLTSSLRRLNWRLVNRVSKERMTISQGTDVEAAVVRMTRWKLGRSPCRWGMLFFQNLVGWFFLSAIMAAMTETVRDSWHHLEFKFSTVFYIAARSLEEMHRGRWT